ncbi:EAL domain-containing protein [Moraxella osloensis]|nr:EAL domain-containing protein [Moraxella osloensis]
MPPNKKSVMPIDHRDCFAGANKLCHDALREYGFIVDSHFFDKQISLEHQNAVFASVFSKIHDGIFMLDEQLRFICVNQQFLNITALPRDQVIGSPFYFYPYKTYALHLQQAIAAIITKLDNRQSISTNLVLSYHNSPEVAVWLDISVCEVDDNRVMYVGLLTNLTKKDAQLSHTLHLYNYDELTGLPNYDSFYEKLKSCIDYYQTADNQRECMGVLLRINIDKLQSFNISLGIENTNTLIQGFVKRVKSLKISGASLVTFSRFGGDSFAAMISVQHLDAAHYYVAALKQLFDLPFSIDNQSIYLRLSIGASIFPTHTQDAQTLLLQADTALKHARLISDEDCVWYDANQQKGNFKDIHLLSAFKNALLKQQILPYFQPKLKFAQPDLPMFEALVRWEHPTLGLLYPNDFLAEVLDKSSQPLFEKIVLACIEQILTWREMGYNCLICINIDSRQLISDKFIEFIEGTIQQYSWLAQSISFEITEVCKIHDEVKAQVMLAKLRQYGFSISIDDFGTGFAAMQYLIKYPIDVLKIDRLFITDILQDTKKQVIVNSVIEMAHSLSMKALAEGVSNREEIEYLRSLGCDSVQGFGFGKPMSGQDTTEWLKANYKPNYLL